MKGLLCVKKRMEFVTVIPFLQASKEVWLNSFISGYKGSFLSGFLKIFFKIIYNLNEHLTAKSAKNT